MYIKQELKEKNTDNSFKKRIELKILKQTKLYFGNSITYLEGIEDYS